MRDQNKNVGSIFSYCCGWGSCLGLLILALALTGCSTVRIPHRQPRNQFGTIQLTNTPSGPVTTSILQAQVMRFADTYVAMVSQGCDDIITGTTNTDIRIAALRWKLQQATAAYNNATGENPTLNALDMLVLATMAHNVVTDFGVPTYGKIVEPLLAAQAEMETNAWTMAGNFLSPAQEKELKNLIDEWRARNPRQTDVGPIRFNEFAAALGRAPTRERTSSGSIFSLLYLNPLAGLDPTTAAIEGVRELGERTMYYTQRMPTLLNWQTQLLVYQLMAQPASAQMQSDFHRISTSMGTFADTGKQLPQIINDQRQAAIQQILDGLVAQENKSTGLLTNTRSALEAASEAATNINTAIHSLTEFVEFVSPTNSTPATATTNSSPPFNVLDYGTAASQIGSAATNLTTLLLTANQSTEQINKISQQMTDNANRVVHHAFWLGVVLILILITGSVVAGLIYRILASKISVQAKAPETKT